MYLFYKVNIFGTDLEYSGSSNKIGRVIYLNYSYFPLPAANITEKKTHSIEVHAM